MLPRLTRTSSLLGLAQTYTRAIATQPKRANSVGVGIGGTEENSASVLPRPVPLSRQSFDTVAALQRRFGTSLSLSSSGENTLQQKADDDPEAASQKNEGALLKEFYKGISDKDKALVVCGGGTTALTYLSTADLEQYTHIVLIGKQGYWNQASYRLGQPDHLLALPHEDSAPFVDPGKHDESKDVLPHEAESAYEHSENYQERLAGLEKFIFESLRKQGKKIHIARDTRVQNIGRDGTLVFRPDCAKENFKASKIVLASGAAPARKLPPELICKVTGNKDLLESDHVLSYTDILTPGIEEKIRGKDVLVYGGGATAAWAMEVCQLHGKPAAWAARTGFGEVEAVGPRGRTILEASRDSQLEGEITLISQPPSLPDHKEKIRVEITQRNQEGAEEKKSFLVDYLVPCIGQDAYGQGGLHDMLSEELKSELVSIPDRNQMSGKADTVLGFGTPSGDIEMLGAAAASYYDEERKLHPGTAISESLPKSGSAAVSISGSIASVTAHTGYMPFSQDPESGEMTVLGLNLNIMNPTQLAVYFTGHYQNADASTINKAVDAYIEKRKDTEFGLSEEQQREFMTSHFGHPETENGKSVE